MSSRLVRKSNYLDPSASFTANITVIDPAWQKLHMKESGKIA
jgi:hypothetical protein